MLFWQFLDCALFDRSLFPLVCAVGFASCCLARSLERGVSRMPAGNRGDEDVFVIVVFCLSGATVLISHVVTRIFLRTPFFVLCCRDQRFAELFWDWQGREHTLH